jgi:putative SOS response-associated peptidase YedK
MCGRFVRKSDLRDAAAFFSVQILDSLLTPNFNISPRQLIAAIMEDGVKKIVSMEWGLIPSWAKDRNIGSKMINSRAETILEKPSFRDAFRKRRCLILADGFYEWTVRDGRKIPVYIYFKDNNPFAMAGIYEYWKPEGGNPIITCSIITVAANEFMKPIHHRMPVILDPGDHSTWLDPQTPSGVAANLLKPCDSTRMQCHEVSTAVNSPANNGEMCIAPHRPIP